MYSDPLRISSVTSKLSSLFQPTNSSTFGCLSSISMSASSSNYVDGHTHCHVFRLVKGRLYECVHRDVYPNLYRNDY